MAREFFCAYHSLLESLTPFGDAECGRLFRACLQYSMSGKEPELGGNERFIWPTLKGMIDRDKQSYSMTCRSNRENGSKGGRPKKEKTEGLIENRAVFSETEKTQEEEKEEEKEKDKGKEDKRKARARFVPPTLEEVRAYCMERNSPVDPQQFFDYFTGDPDRQWVDAKGQPVASWKQKLITWEKFQGQKHPEPKADSLEAKYSMMGAWASD